MQMTEQAPKRPFHETIVEAIRRATNSEELICLANLIKTTKIPKNHDEIIMAWNERMKAMGWGDVDLGVPADLLEQKREEVEKTKEKEQAGVTS